LKKKPKQNRIELQLEQELNESFEHLEKLHLERENFVSLGLGA
jgi:hypothetical protein